MHYQTHFPEQFAIRAPILEIDEDLLSLRIFILSTDFTLKIIKM